MVGQMAKRDNTDLDGSGCNWPSVLAPSMKLLLKFPEMIGPLKTGVHYQH